jgi:hypothetical protein
LSDNQPDIPRLHEPRPLDIGARLELPLTLNTTKSFEVFLSALDDPDVREGLRRQRTTLPAGVTDVLTMLDDTTFLDMSFDAARKYRAMLRERTTVQEVKETGAQLHDYLSSNYPAGLRIMQNYADAIGPQVLAGQGGTVEIHSDVVANVEAVVNAAVYVDAAVATHVAVAVVVVVVLAVFVV